MYRFVISDLHFGHDNCYKFLNRDGSKMRPFENSEEADAEIIKRWNSVVAKDDKVYVLGDICFKNQALKKIGLLNGTKILIRGNHDNLKAKEYLRYFSDVRSYKVYDKYILSHIPIHPQELSRYKGNIHGHLHSGIIQDPHYLNVCVEHLNYTPIKLGEAIRRIEHGL